MLNMSGCKRIIASIYHILTLSVIISEIIKINQAYPDSRPWSESGLFSVFIVSPESFLLNKKKKRR